LIGLRDIFNWLWTGSKKKNNSGSFYYDKFLRDSSTETATMQHGLTKLFQYSQGINPWTPVQIMDLLAKIAHTNPLINKAWRYYRKVGSSGHKLVIDDRTDAEVERIQMSVNDLSERVYARKGHIEGFIDHCFQELAIFGGIAVEAILMPRREMIFDIEPVAVRQIRFKQEKDIFVPYQLTKDGKMIKLDERTFHFSALDTADGSPYPIPPFISAIPDVIKREDIGESVKNILYKLGIYGLLMVQIKNEHLDPIGNVEDRKKMAAYRSEIANSITGAFKDGVAVSYDDVSWEAFNPVANASGVKDLANSINEDILSGVDIEPALVGRAYKPVLAAMEVLWRLAKRDVQPHQRRVCGALDHIVHLDLGLQGIDPRGVSVQFNENPEANPQASAVAKSTEHARIRENVKAGYVSPDDGAREMGYSSAYDSEKAYNSHQSSTFGLRDDGGQECSHSPGMNSRRVELSFENGRYHYRRPLVILKKKSEAELMSVAERQIQSRINDYISKLAPSSNGAREAAMRQVDNFLDNGSFSNFLNEDQFALALWDLIETAIANEMNGTPVQEAVEYITGEAYEFYRLRDKSVWQGRPPMEFMFGSRDYRAIQTIADWDRWYLGKFIQGEESQKQGLDFLRKQYLEKGEGLFGRADSEVFNRFRREFSGKISEMSDYQIRRVADTSIVRIRSYGQFGQYHEAGVTKARWVTVGGACDICQPFDGIEWSIAPTLATMDRELAMNAGEFGTYLTRKGTIKPPENSGQVEGHLAGGIMPPVHCNCKCRTVGVP